VSSKGGNVTVSQNVDPATQAYVNQLRQAALGYAGIGGGQPAPTAPPVRTPFSMGGGRAGFNLWQMQNRAAQNAPGQPVQPDQHLPPATIDPALLQALKGYQGYSDVGQMGLTALSGGANPFMNAYLQGLNPIWQQMREQALGTIGQQATQAGAYGGSRQGVAEGVALGELGNAQAAQQYQAFNDSQNRAAQAAQFGLAGLGGSAELARYMQEYPQLFASRQLGLLQQGIGPYGTTQTQETQSDPFSSLLGAGLTIGSFFVPGGPLARAATAGAGQQILGNPPSYPDFG